VYSGEATAQRFDKVIPQPASSSERETESFADRRIGIQLGVGMLGGLNAGLAWRIPMDSNREYSFGPEISVGMGIRNWNLVLSGGLIAQYISEESGFGGALGLRGYMEKWTRYNSGEGEEAATRRIIGLIPGLVARNGSNLFTFSVGPGVAFTSKTLTYLPYVKDGKVEDISETEVVWEIALNFTF
jgi:hypothetical protein